MEEWARMDNRWKGGLRIFSNGDSLLASQYAYLHKASPSTRPIPRLMLAVLGDAIDCFFSESLYSAYPTSRRGRLRAEAERWLFDETATGPFSFNWICDGLDLDASYLLGGVRRVEAKRRKLTSSNGL
jgi:hypothetical protein